MRALQHVEERLRRQRDRARRGEGHRQAVSPSTCASALTRSMPAGSVSSSVCLADVDHVALRVVAGEPGRLRQRVAGADGARRRAVGAARAAAAPGHDGGEHGHARERGAKTTGHRANLPRATSKQASAPAAATFSESIRPLSGMLATASHRSRTSRESPSPRRPSTSATGSAARRQVEQRLVAGGVEADDPDAGLLQLADGGRQTADQGHRQVLDGARPRPW